MERYTQFLVNELSSNFRQSDPTPKILLLCLWANEGLASTHRKFFQAVDRKTTQLNPKQISNLAFLLICHRFSPLNRCLSDVLQLNKRGYLENLQTAICPNKRPSFEPFTHHSKPKFSALHSNHPILSLSLSDNKTALVLKQQQKTFFLTVKTRAPGRRCSLPINQHLAHECIAAISWCASAMNQAATETGEQARRRQVMSWLVVGLLTSRQRHRKTPSTALRHPSFGGRCRKAMRGFALFYLSCL